MGATELCATQRLKREDCKRTKHDSYFSKWKILIGPSDWEDYSQGKEGATRYRIHNLPISSEPGLYELGIADVPNTSLRREVSKLDSSRIVVVYLGQAGNVRTRLQNYGRSGAHLGRSYSSSHNNATNEDALLEKGRAIFDEIFSRGYSIVFRWTSMESKSDAEKTEARLLDRFDYAWNKGRNGAWRPNDVLEKLNKLSSRSIRFPNIMRKIQIFSQKPVGVKIKACKPVLLENECSVHKDEDNEKNLSRVFSFSRSRPILVSVKSHADDGTLLPACGVTLNDGTSCRKPPVPGRVRCKEHKGMKNCGSISNSTTKVKSSYLHDTYLNSNSRHQDEISICGVELGNGMLCKNSPVVQRKRCEEHKGLRVNSLVPKFAAKDNLCT